MNGRVDSGGRALLEIAVRSNLEVTASTVNAWVDTGFTGELVLPQETIHALGLAHSGSVDAILADGTQVELRTYTCYVSWFGADRRLEVIANEGEHALLGVGMLLGLELRVNYHSLELALSRP
jgi:clan AA aspartic protease